MALGPETAVGADRSHEGLHAALEAGGSGKVLDRSAGATDEVVVVAAGDLLVELVADVLVGARHPVNGASLTQDRQIPVRRALREGRAGHHQLGRREGPVGLGQGCHQVAASTGVPLPDGRHPAADRDVNLVVHRANRTADSDKLK